MQACCACFGSLTLSPGSVLTCMLSFSQTQSLQFHSGYSVEDLAPVARKLLHMLNSPSDSKLATIRSKYSHK